MAVTLLRASGELGELGLLPKRQKPQCLRDIEVEFAVECHQAGERFSAFRRAKAFQVPLQLFRLQNKREALQQRVASLTIRH